MLCLCHTVTPQEDGLTLQQLLRGPLGLSYRQVKTAKQQDAVSVDAAPFFSNQPVRAGMVVRVHLKSFADEARANEPSAAACPPGALRVLYEDDALIAVHKPALLQCHPSPSAPNGSDTLEARVRAYLRADAHPVHRLDAETTGIVLFAKLPYAQAHLQRQMQAGTFGKVYHAWVYGTLPRAEDMIDAPIARISPDNFTRAVTPGGQRAVSRYRLLRAVTLEDGCVPAALVELHPLTGRTHQLRVHMTHIGCPLLGDTRYFTESSRAASLALGLRYHQLASVSLWFLHPVSGEEIELRCPAQFSPVPGLSAP